MARIIDGKGRVFGLINIVDLMVVLFVLIVCSIGLTMYFSENETRWINVEVVTENDVMETLHPGDTIIKKGEKIAQVEELHKINTADGTGTLINMKILAELDKNNMLFEETELKVNKKIDLTFRQVFIDNALIISINMTREYSNISVLLDLGTLDKEKIEVIKNKHNFFEKNGKLNGIIKEIIIEPSKGTNEKISLIVILECELKDNGCYYDQTIVKLDSTVTLDFSDASFSATVKEIEPKDKKYKTLKIFLENKGVEQWYTDSINIGDSEKTFNNKIIVEVVGKEVTASEMVVTTEKGEVFLREHPTKKDIVLELEINVIEINEGLSFHGEEIKLGKNLYFETEDYDFSGLIVGVE